MNLPWGVTRLLCRDIANLWGLSLVLAALLPAPLITLSQLFCQEKSSDDEFCDEWRTPHRARKMRFQFGIARQYFPHRIAIFHHTNKQMHYL
jgi:hypothetical protein